MATARSGRFTPHGVTPLTPIMGQTTDPGENHDPGNDQHARWRLTREHRLENGLAPLWIRTLQNDLSLSPRLA